MQDPHELVEKFVKPWIEKNHPNAAIVIMAGSYGRAMRQGNYQPLSSSDMDLIIIYTDLEKGGYKTATKTFQREEVGLLVGEAQSRVMMIDTNIHDFASLIHHYQYIKDHLRVPFIPVMVDEGYVVVDKTGVGGILQQQANQYMKDGPSPMSQKEWQQQIDRIEGYLTDIMTAGSVEEKRFLGTMALAHAADYALCLHQYWRAGPNNQAYRNLSKYWPDDCQRLTDSFSALMRGGDSQGVELLLEEYIKRGRELMKKLPAATDPEIFPVGQFVPKEEIKKIDDLFQKFIVEHVCEALDTAIKRGELSYLHALSATLHNTKNALQVRDGDRHTEGVDAMHYLNRKLPDMMPMMLQAIDEGLHDPLRKIANEVLSNMGGMDYSVLQTYYTEDMARVYATKPALKEEKTKKWFAPGYKP